MSDKEVHATRSFIEIHSWQLDEQALVDFLALVKDNRDKASKSS